MERPIVLLELLMAASTAVLARAADVEIVASFDGNKGPGWKAAANVMGAVGPRHVVDFTTGGFTVHDKTTGKVLRHLSQREFWSQVEPAGSIVPEGNANDPWMVYDPLSERWFATIAGTSPATPFLAVSVSSDPTQAWRGARLPLPQIDPGMKIGVDKNGLYISCANGASDLNEALDLYVIPKADAIASGGPVLTRATTFSKLVYAAFPAVDLDPNKTPDAPAVLLNNEFGGETTSRLYLYKITWSAAKPRISEVQAIPLSKTYWTPRMEGIQPDGGVKLVQAGGRRNNCAFVHGGSVFGCNGAQRAADSRPGILWYEVRIRDGALLQEGFVDHPDHDYLYPSMAVDSRGNIGIGCTRTSAKEYPSVCVMMHAAGDPPGAIRAPVVAVKGTTVFQYADVAATNFSNYSATCIDPSAGDLLWTYQGYANSTVDRQWCTAWVAFKLSPAVVPASQPLPDGKATTFNVLDYGAKGDGVTDDAPAIQRAINAAAARPGGGRVVFPKGAYLLDSAYPSSHPWAFYNLQIESGVMLCGETGARLLQGPRGRRPLPEGAETVRNSVLAFGADHQVIRFQNRQYNGGFLALKATQARSATATLVAASDAAKFRPGDYVAIYETSEGDVIPTETGRIAAVNATNGELRLAEPLTRSFRSPWIANVTRLATTNVGVKNLIVQGSEPLTVTEVFGFTAEDCHFINDTSIGGGNVIDYNMNTLNGFRFLRNRFTSVGPGYAVMEMTQRNSRHGVWERNTFEIVQGGMGEYAADIRFTNNTFRLHPNDRTSVGLMIGGTDIVFRGNTVTCGRITAGEGWGCVLADCVGPGYERYVGNIQIADNLFTYQGDGNQCVHLVARDTSFTGNTVIVKGSAMGVRGEGPPPQSLTIKNNTFWMGTGAAIMIASHGVDGSTVTGNTITGSGAYGIYVASPDKPNTGKHVIFGNAVKGYRNELFIDLALHPGTILKGNEQPQK